MPKYYGIQRTDEYLMHYGIKGMHWGVRKLAEKAKKMIAKIKQKRIEHKINVNSEGPRHDFDKEEKFIHNGYFNGQHAPEGSARYNLAMKMFDEVFKRANTNAEDVYWSDPKVEKAWNYVGSKHKKDYLKAVLTDARLPINKQNLETAHKIISAKDSGYTDPRYNNSSKKRRRNNS